MPSGKKYDRQQPGKVIRAKTINDPINAVENLQRARSGPGLTKHDVAGIPHWSAELPHEFDAEITGGGTGGLYNLTEVLDTTGGGWSSYTNGRSVAAYEFNLTEGLTSGIRVTVRYFPRAGEWRFQMGDCAAPSTIDPSEDPANGSSPARLWNQYDPWTVGHYYHQTQAWTPTFRPSSLPQNEKQRISTTGGSGGDYLEISLDGAAANQIFHGDNAATVETALEASANIDDVVVTGGPLGTADLIVEFQGTQAGTDVNQMVIDVQTPGWTTATISTDQDGG